MAEGYDSDLDKAYRILEGPDEDVTVNDPARALLASLDDDEETALWWAFQQHDAERLHRYLRATGQLPAT